MKFKEIKPGMVIHCPKEEDARALLKYLDANDYDVPTLPETYNHETDCFKLYDCGDNVKIVSYGTRQHYLQSTEKNTITEFSDLIEPDSDAVPKIEWEFDLKKGCLEGKPVSDSPINSDTDSPMSAKDAIRWLMVKPNAIIAEVLGYESLDEVFRHNSVEGILEQITTYEAAKKAPKPVEVEEGYYCCIYKASVGCAVDDYVLWGVDRQTAEDDAKGKALKRTEEIGEQMHVCVEFTCRIKESE